MALHWPPLLPCYLHRVPVLQTHKAASVERLSQATTPPRSWSQKKPSALTSECRYLDSGRTS
ncbi:hypothetical protein CCUS01_12668 [Colletotrichum cuscutae]|uniref:Uncharacterized protein n=1 Tax=Colletotrichum cuscutae TaxID=1209917 RepID=A0AAI9TVG3_9PEZI|nr:hypothetical protein CCUS01_12668 [Colletotrichum cuscutae]